MFAAHADKYKHIRYTTNGEFSVYIQSEWLG